MTIKWDFFCGGIGIIGVGLTLFLALPPPWWPKMPTGTLHFGIASGVILMAVGAAMSLVGILPDQLENRLGPMTVLALGVGFVISAAMWWRWQILPNDADNNTSSLKAPVPTQLLNNPPPGVGGSAYSQGDRNQVQGGQGSAPGLGGLGGAGGNAISNGNDNIVRGGDAGARGRNPMDGGDGGRPGYIATPKDPTLQRALLIEQLMGEYLATHKDAPPAYTASPRQVPEDWINERLKNIGEIWRVKNAPPGQGYLIFAPDNSKNSN